MRRLFLFAALLLTFAAPVAGQDAPHRGGFWIGFGLGAGSAGFDCDDCGDDRQNSGAGYLRLGGTASDQWLVGGEINGWAKSDEEPGFEWEAVVASIFGTALFYPSAGNFYLQGGLGFTAFAFEVEDDVGDTAKFETSGMAVLLGIGYDISVARGFSLTPYVSYSHGFSSEVEVSSGDVSIGIPGELNPNVFQFGLGFTWH